MYDFNEWMKQLENYMFCIKDNSGMPLIASDWMDKEGWIKLFDSGLSPEEAYYEAC